MRVPGRCGDRCRTTTSLRPYVPMTKTGTIPFQAPSGSATMYSAPQTLSSEVQDLRCARARDGASLCTASPLHTLLGDSCISEATCDPVLTSQAKGVEHFHSQSYEPRGGAREQRTPHHRPSRSRFILRKLEPSARQLVFHPLELRCNAKLPVLGVGTSTPYTRAHVRGRRFVRSLRHA